MKKARMTIEILMVVLLPLLVAYSLIGDYLLMKVMFAFFDLREPKIRFLLDYTAVMVLVAEIAYWIQSRMNRH